MIHTCRIAALSALVALSSLSCAPRSKEAGDTPVEATDQSIVLTAEQLATARLSTAIVQTRDASELLRLPGTIEVDPRRSWRISPVVEGVIEEVGVVPHAMVRQGQMLARFRSTALGEAQVAWLEARAAHRLSSADRERSLALRKDGVVSESQWLRVDTEFQRAQMVLAQAERKLTLAGVSARERETLGSPGSRLGEMTLSSPAAGIVLSSTASRGQAFAAGQDAFVIADLSTLWVTLHIPVASLLQVRSGAKATVHVVGTGGRGASGQVSTLGGQVDPANQTVEGRVIVPNPGGFLRPGMHADVEVSGAPVHALMVPSGAVFTVGNLMYLFQKVSATKFRPLAVTAGPPLGSWTPVTGPEVKAGVEVVVGGLAELKSHWQYNGASK